MANTVASQISMVLLEELNEAAQRGEFGVVVRDVKPLDFSALASAAGPLSSKRGPCLRLSLVDQNDAVMAARADEASMGDFLSANEEDAVQWRNERLRTIAVVAQRPLAKAASLRDFRSIGEVDPPGCRWPTGRWNSWDATWPRSA